MRRFRKRWQKKKIIKDCDQCRAKIKKLKLEYHKEKDKNGKNERGRAMWRYFKALDAILGNKPATKPPIVIDTGAEEVIEDEAEASDYTEDEEMSDMTGKSQTTSSSTVTTEDEQEQPSNTSSGIKGKTRKRSREDKMESMMKMVVKEVVDSQSRSDKMFLEMEEKCIKFEAEQKKEERISNANDVHVMW